MRLLSISLCSALSSCLSQFLCLLLSSNLWNFSLRPVDGCEQYTPWYYVRVAFPCPCTDNPPSLPRKSLTNTPCTHTHAVHSPTHPFVHLSFCLLRHGQQTQMGIHFIYWFLWWASISPQCVCIRFRPSVYDLSQGACDNQTQGRGNRKRDNNKEWEREGETDILIIAHPSGSVSESTPLPPSFPPSVIHSDSNRSVK